MPNNDDITHHIHSQVGSPCVRNCCLDDTDMCVGCFRMMSEILHWKQSSNEAKRDILEQCRQRKINQRR